VEEDMISPHQRPDLMIGQVPMEFHRRSQARSEDGLLHRGTEASISGVIQLEIREDVESPFEGLDDEEGALHRLHAPHHEAPYRSSGPFRRFTWDGHRVSKAVGLLWADSQPHDLPAAELAGRDHSFGFVVTPVSRLHSGILQPGSNVGTVGLTQVSKTQLTGEIDEGQAGVHPLGQNRLHSVILKEALYSSGMFVTEEAFDGLTREAVINVGFR
jgi:hypothetical protein